MPVFIAFVVIVLLGLALQWLSNRWQIATGIPCLLFLGFLMSGQLFPKYVLMAFTLGTPMVFFAALLGSFLYETRLNPNNHDNSNDSSSES